MSIFRSKGKIFVIGRNKTGTTSMGEALASLGFEVGEQAAAEDLLQDWAKRDFRAVIKYCAGSDAFQDVPFSLSYTYQAMDQAFRGSKFILTVRNDSSEWYESLVRFHAKIVGKGRLPTAEDLKAYDYHAAGWLWEAQKLIYGINEDTLYDREIYVEHYERHNRDVMEYFRHRPGDLLVLNVAWPDAMEQLCRFLGIAAAPGAEMPHLNRSRS